MCEEEEMGAGVELWTSLVMGVWRAVRRSGMGMVQRSVLRLGLG